MIDYRYNTFLNLCRIKNYTKTAAKLNITQPTVSQHIKHLENYYDTKLFTYNRKNLKITEAGKKLYEYTVKIAADSKKIKEVITDSSDIKNIKFGATLSIGEFIMPDILNKVMEKNYDFNFDMLVENTESLLKKLKKGEINFAILEGFFDKSKFGYQLFSQEKFIGICSPNSKYSQRKFKLDDLLDARLILREKGSGTREILEQILYTNNLSEKSFINKIEIGNLNAIKKLVSHNKGISFIYQAAAQEELKKNNISILNIPSFDIKREFNFVYLKNSVFKSKYQNYFKLFKDFR